MSIDYFPTHAQTSKQFPQGLQFEIGGGHNQLKWHVIALPEFGIPEQDYNRQQFSFTPTLRVSYQLSFLDYLQLAPFVGYNQFGGKSREESNGYKDEFWFNSLEVGGLLCYQQSPLAFGVGIKYNRHLKIINRFYGYYTDPEYPSQRSWQEKDAASVFKNYSFDAGLRISWNEGHWSVSAESWFALTQIEAPLYDVSEDIRENHYRILLGYTL